MMSNMDFVGVQVFFSLTRRAFIFGVRSTNLGSELPKRGRCITPSVLIVSSIKPFGSKEYISPRADNVNVARERLDDCFYYLLLRRRELRKSKRPLN